MTTPAELEASLATAWDLDVLAVLADVLQAAGDPRGELIALDLHAGRHGATDEHATRKHALQVAWLGEVGAHPAVGVDHGFLTLDVAVGDDHTVIERVLAHPGTRTLRTVTIAGESIPLANHVAALAKARHPWLRRLAVHRLDKGWESSIEGAAAKRLVAATPALEVLTLRGHRVFSVFAHPTVQRLSIDNCFALGPHGLRGADRAMPALAFARIGAGFGLWTPIQLEELFDVNGTPALTRLDVSAELTGIMSSVPTSQPTVLALLASLRQLPIKRQLTHLWLPAIRTGAEHTELELAVATMPALVELHVPKPLLAPLQHPAAVIVGRQS